jgi:hypothetical protein
VHGPLNVKLQKKRIVYQNRNSLQWLPVTNGLKQGFALYQPSGKDNKISKDWHGMEHIARYFVLLMSTCLAKRDKADSDGLKYKQNNYINLSQYPTNAPDY